MLNPFVSILFFSSSKLLYFFLLSATYEGSMGSGRVMLAGVVPERKNQRLQAAPVSGQWSREFQPVPPPRGLFSRHSSTWFLVG